MPHYGLLKHFSKSVFLLFLFEHAHMYMGPGVCATCMHIHVEAKKSIGSCGDGVTVGCKSPSVGGGRRTSGRTLIPLNN